MEKYSYPSRFKLRSLFIIDFRVFRICFLNLKKISQTQWKLSDPGLNTLIPDKLVNPNWRFRKTLPIIGRNGFGSVQAGNWFGSSLQSISGNSPSCSSSNTNSDAKKFSAWPYWYFLVFLPGRRSGCSSKHFLKILWNRWVLSRMRMVDFQEYWTILTYLGQHPLAINSATKGRIATIYTFCPTFRLMIY